MGRFQEIDESAYYEDVLKRVGIAVHYCAEHADIVSTGDIFWDGHYPFID